MWLAQMKNPNFFLLFVQPEPVIATPGDMILGPIRIIFTKLIAQSLQTVPRDTFWRKNGHVIAARHVPDGAGQHVHIC